MPTIFKQLALFTVLLWLALPPIMAQQAEEVPFETVIKYSSNGPRKELQRIVTDKRDWKRIWKKAHRNFPSVPPLPEVDFSQRMIIVVAFEYLPDPSYTIAISKIIMTEDMLRVVVKETTRSGRFCAPSPDILVYPLHIVEAERVKNKLIRNVQFEVERETVDCQPPG